MRRHHFFIEKELSVGKSVHIDNSELLHQWGKVFRLGKGDEVVLLPNDGFEYLCEFDLLTKKEAELRVNEKREGIIDVKRKVHLYQALTKRDTFEWVLQKGTELGVASFTPLLTSRTEKTKLNMERAQKIVREAAEQSGWATLPIVHEPQPIADALEHVGNPIVFDLGHEQFVPEEASTDVSLFIGPEGGWDEHEQDLFEFKKIPMYSLGSQTLRAETAAVAVCTKLLL